VTGANARQRPFSRRPTSDARDRSSSARSVAIRFKRRARSRWVWSSAC